MDGQVLMAVKAGDLARLKQLLDDHDDDDADPQHGSRIEVNARDANGRTALHHAASSGQHEIVKCLLENGADVLLCSSEKNNSALHIAMAKSEHAVALAILESLTPRSKLLRKLLETRTRSTGSAALHVAAKNDCYAGASLLLRHGANFEVISDAAQKPVDLTPPASKLRALFQLIDKSFARAESGETDGRRRVQLADELDRLSSSDFNALINCRNGQGHTIVQVLLLNEHYRLANALLCSRVLRYCQLPLSLDPRGKSQLDESVRGARRFREFWTKHRAEGQTLQQLAASANDNAETNCRLAAVCGALEKAHEVLLACRQLKALTDDPSMITLEEIFEALGFDPERRLPLPLHVEAADAANGRLAQACYYERLPVKWRENMKSLELLMDALVDSAIDFYLGCIYSAQTLSAAKDDDLELMQRLISYNVINHGVDDAGRTPLCYAVDNSSEKMVRLLLENGASVAGSGADCSSPVRIATSNNDAKLVKLLLKRVAERELAELIDRRQDLSQCTALHVAAKNANLDIVKTLLRHGATYCIFDLDNRTPLDYSTSQQVSHFLRLVDQCFREANQADLQLISKLEAMPIDDFMAVAKTRNLQGRTLADVATKIKARSIADAISKTLEKEARKQWERHQPFVFGKKCHG